ncbi:MAG: prephenate dehydrogenase [Isosphaeraceae bacterium]
MASFGTVTVVGVGLIGGSIGLALRSRSLAKRVIGVGRSESSLAEARRLGAIDAYTTVLAEGTSDAEIVVVCTPVDQVATFVVKAAESGSPRLLVTDAASTKRTIVEEVERHAPARTAYVGAHPIAGSERQGAAFADALLFEGRACVLTPTRQTPEDRLARARSFWSSIGCRILETSPAEHDQTLAMTSHLPHAVSAALARVVPPEALAMAAGAYRDGTRVAGADANLWAAIFLENRDPLLRALDRFASEIHAFRTALEAHDGDALIAWWQDARARRSQFDPNPRPANPPVQD